MLHLQAYLAWGSIHRSWDTGKHLSTAPDCDTAATGLFFPLAFWRPGHPADSSWPAALHHILHWGRGLHLLQLLQQRAHCWAEDSSRSTLRTVLSPGPDADLKDRLLPVESPTLPQWCHSKVGSQQEGWINQRDMHAGIWLPGTIQEGLAYWADTWSPTDFFE